MISDCVVRGVTGYPAKGPYIVLMYSESIAFVTVSARVLNATNDLKSIINNMTSEH